MSAKKLGRLAASLFVALGLAFGGSLLAAAAGVGAAAVTTNAAPVVSEAMTADVEWH